MSKTFTATNPATGQAVGNPIIEHSFEEVTAAIAAAEKIKAKFAATSPTQRAALLNAIADSIESEKEALDYLENSKEWQEVLQYENWASTFLKRHPELSRADSLRRF